MGKMSVAVTNRMVDSYFRVMRNWNTDAKKDLIIKLTASIDSKTNDDHDFSSCFGAWEDERTADEIINELKADRVNSKEIEPFE
jgi:hypothetical protein